MAISNPFKKLSKTQAYLSLAGFTGITGYLAYRHHASTGSWNPWSSGSAATATTSTTQVDPVTGLPYSQDDATDPATGLTYLAEAEQYGSVQAAEADVSQFGTSAATGSGVGVQPATYPVTNSPAGTQTGTPYTSNAAWAQAVQAGLTDVGYDPEAVATALGDYLTQTPLTSDQAGIVRTAIAEYGPAPVGNLQVILAPPSQPATTATVPSVTGKTVAEADSAITAAGLVPGANSGGTGTVSGQSPAAGTVVARQSKVNLTLAAAGGGSEATPGPVAGFSVTPHKGFADFGWHAVGNADNYQLAVSGPQAIDRYTGNVLNAEHVTLKRGKYTAKIRADNHGKLGPWSAPKTFTVT